MDGTSQADDSCGCVRICRGLVDGRTGFRARRHCSGRNGARASGARRQLRARRLVSTSSASDRSFIAIAEIGALLAGESHRLIGGVAVVLSGERTATVDLLVPSYRTRLRQAVRYGSTNTVEVGGLAEALRRPHVRVVGEVRLTDGDVVQLDVLLPDLASLLGLKLQARRVRDVDRDAVDLWTCLELMAAAGETASFGDAEFDPIRSQLAIDFAEDGPVMRVAVAGVDETEAAHRRTRIRGLARAVARPL